MSQSQPQQDATPPGAREGGRQRNHPTRLNYQELGNPMDVQTTMVHVRGVKMKRVTATPTQRTPPATAKSTSGKSKTSVSSTVRKQRLQFEARKKVAAIQKELTKKAMEISKKKEELRASLRKLEMFEKQAVSGEPSMEASSNITMLQTKVIDLESDLASLEDELESMKKDAEGDYKLIEEECQLYVAELELSEEEWEEEEAAGDNRTSEWVEENFANDGSENNFNHSPQPNSTQQTTTAEKLPWGRQETAQQPHIPHQEDTNASQDQFDLFGGGDLQQQVKTQAQVNASLGSTFRGGGGLFNTQHNPHSFNTDSKIKGNGVSSNYGARFTSDLYGGTYNNSSHHHQRAATPSRGKNLHNETQSFCLDDLEDKESVISSGGGNNHFSHVHHPSPQPVSNPDLVTQLVTAFGQALGSHQQQQQVIVKTTVDKDLPSFCGRPEEWIAFKAQYDRSSRNHKFDNTDNLYRLQKALKGAALDAVKHLFCSPDNVGEIMESLEMEFGRPERIIENLISTAEGVKNPDINKPDTILEYCRAVQSLVTAAVGCKMEDYLNNVHLLTKLCDKLPAQLRKEWIVWYTADPSRKKNLKFYADWIKIQKNLACEMSAIKVIEAPDTKKDKRSRRGPAVVHAAAAEDGDINTCAHCGKRGHCVSVCYSYKKLKVMDRWSVVRKQGLCFVCLEKGHHTKNCKISQKCGFDGCQQRHHQSLHYVKSEKKIEASQQPKEKDSPTQQAATPSTSAGVTLIKGTDGPLAIVPIRLKGPAGIQKTYALLDTGASRTFVEKELALKLGVEGTTVDFSCIGFGGKDSNDPTAQEVNLEVSGNYKGATFNDLRNCVTIERIGLPPYSIDVECMKKRWPHLQKMTGTSLVDAVPRVIIGNDHAKLMVPKEVLEMSGDTPIATRCKLGWVVSGNCGKPGGKAAGFQITGVVNYEDHLHKLIKDFFSTESFGVKVTRPANQSLQDKRAIEIMDTTSRKVGNRWETGLLWKSDDISLPESKAAAMKRLISTEKAKKGPEYAAMYNKKFEEYMAKGYIRKLTPEEASKETERTWYIPHFGVTNVNKPGKLRLVFDAAAQSNGVCLNNMLLKGPDLLRPLTSILWNWRIHRVVIIGDIEDMFHRVLMTVDNHNSQRFLWRDCDTSRAPDVYVVTVLIFGSKCSPSSAIYIKNRNAQQFQDTMPAAVKAIQRDIYTDDCITGANSESEAIKLRSEITDINAAGGFVMKKWMSNSKAVINSIPKDLRAEGTRALSESTAEESTERVLGLRWDPLTDQFTFQLNFHKVAPEILQGRTPTKREASSLVMSLYDPLGFIGQFKVKGIMVLQSTWRSGIGWDDELSDAVSERWNKWVVEIPKIQEVRIPRCYSEYLTEADTIELHTFVDASEEAFAAVCYFVIRKEDKVDVAFVQSKARVSPLKKLTIPKMELQAAVMGARVASYILEEVEIAVTARHFWSDSRTVLSWIQSESSRYKEFVANRIGEVQEMSDVSEWHWVPTKLNVADDATRFSSEVDFSPESRWLRGPEFLHGDPTEWPTERVKKLEDQEDEELRKVAVGFSVATELSRVSRFSSFLRLCRATAAVKAAAKHWLEKIRSKKGTAESTPWSWSESGRVKVMISHLTPVQIAEAEKQLLMVVQSQEYPEELKLLADGKTVTKRSKIWKLSPTLVDGLICVRGRIDAANGISPTMKRPVILPSRHQLSALIIHDEHVRNAHQGQETVFNNLKQRFWITDGRQAVKRAFSACWECKVKKVKPVIPEMGSLPHYRLASNQPPFTFTGVDFFGPIEATVGRRHEKRWGALFCCMVTRAIHLEVAHNLSSDEMMMVLSRFMDSRGRPSHIYSDNGTNFVGASKELKLAFQEMQLEKIASSGKFHSTEWHFNPPGAPHMGGAWERLIQSVKKVLHNVLRDKYPRDSTLLTALKAAENIVNSRPLTHVSSDPDDEESLTPNHFLRGFSDVGPPFPAEIEGRDEHLRTKWRYSQCLAKQFWERWTKEYLPSLLEREKWHQDSEPMQVGDLVIMVDNQAPRNCWTRGIISKVYPAENGQVRVADVTTRNFATKRTFTYQRPVHKLCPLGLRIKDSGLWKPKIGGQNVDGN